MSILKCGLLLDSEQKELLKEGFTITRLDRHTRHTQHLHVSGQLTENWHLHLGARNAGSTWAALHWAGVVRFAFGQICSPHTHATNTHKHNANPIGAHWPHAPLDRLPPSAVPRAVTHTVISRLPTVEVKSLGVHHEPRLVPRIDLVEPHSQGAKPGLRSDA